MHWAYGAGHHHLQVGIAPGLQKIQGVQQHLHFFVGAELAEGHDLTWAWRQRKIGDGHAVVKGAVRRQQHVVGMILFDENLDILGNRDCHLIHAEQQAGHHIAGGADDLFHHRFARIPGVFQIYRLHDVVEQHHGGEASKIHQLGGRETQAGRRLFPPESRKLEIEEDHIGPYLSYGLQDAPGVAQIVEAPTGHDAQRRLVGGGLCPCNKPKLV